MTRAMQNYAAGTVTGEIAVQQTVPMRPSIEPHREAFDVDAVIAETRAAAIKAGVDYDALLDEVAAADRPHDGFRQPTDEELDRTVEWALRD